MPSEEHETVEKDGFLLYVRELVNLQQFNTWFRHVTVEETQDRTVRLLVPNPFVMDWISNYYSDVLSEAVRRRFGDDRIVTLAIDPNAPAPANIDREPVSPRRNGSHHESRNAADHAALAIHSDTVLHEDYTFDHFVVGTSNRFAHAAAVAVADSPGKSYNPFFLHGSVGLGKTHLLQAICHEILKRDPAANIVYLSCETFTNQFISSIENNDLTTFRLKYRNVDVLLVDDIHLLANKDRTQEEFFHTFNTVYNMGHQIVLSSDAPPKDIPTLQERLVSRFKMGLVVEIAPPDFETRVNILKRKARMRGRTLPDDVSHFLAEQVSTNIRELEGSVVRLLGYASLVDRPISLELAREAMLDGSSPRTSIITIHDIVSVVTRYFNVKLSDLQSKRRTQSIAFPRQVCMYLARENTSLSLEEIGGYFGGRDHTTVIYATEKIKKVIEENPRQAEIVRHLDTDIKG